MHTLTEDELKRAPLSPLEDAVRGEPTLVTSHGQPVMLALPLGPNAGTPAALLDLAVTLYDSDQISLGRAAEVAGLGYSQMIDELGRRNIAVVRYGLEDFERELEHVGTLAGGR